MKARNLYINDYLWGKHTRYAVLDGQDVIMDGFYSLRDAKLLIKIIERKDKAQAERRKE